MRTDQGEDVTARYLIAAVGSLSATNIRRFNSLERFKGKCYHTKRFLYAGVDFTNKRVGVVGTGATAVQAIAEIAQQAKQLTVFQRTANYCVPVRNGKADPEVTRARNADYDGIVQRTHISFLRQESYFIPKSVLDAMDQWVAHVNEDVGATLMTGANSWYMSANIPGKPRAFLPYLGPEGVGGYRKKCDEVAANGYEGFELA